MQIVSQKMSRSELHQYTQKMGGEFVKAVVDLGQSILAIDAEMHVDLEAFLLESGSKQDDLWGINLYPDIPGEDWIEYDSMINLRPRQGNRSRGVENLDLQIQIRELVEKLLPQDA